ncbi:MAG: cytochrome c oxidase assembly protein [Alphaproteobacteria bacterium]
MGLRNNNRIVATIAVGVVASMVGLSFAAVPLYRLFCQVTGYGGTTQIAKTQKPVLNKSACSVDVTLVSNVNARLPWSFKPLQNKVHLKLGEETLAYYRAKNLGNVPITGVATFNVTPHKAGPYFIKIACFCFTEQTLQPGESVDMPVTFYIDPEIVNDRKLDDVSDIALSYTFFRAPNMDAKKVSGIPGGARNTY